MGYTTSMKYIPALLVLIFLFPLTIFAQADDNINCLLPNGSVVNTSLPGCSQQQGTVLFDNNQSPPTASPQSDPTEGLQGLITNIIQFLSGVVVPFLFGIAFLFFVINAIRYFVIGGSNEEGQKKARQLAIYGIAAFVFLIVFYGIVNLLVNSIDLEGTANMPCPDYIKVSGGCQ